MRGVKLVSAIVVVGFLVPSGASAVLCAAKNGILRTRPSCKKHETTFDIGPLVAGSSAVTQLSGQASQLSGQFSQLSTQLAGKLGSGDKGTVKGYATVASDGTLKESFTTAAATVTSVRNMLGQYTVNFGFQIRPDQPMVAVPRETFGHEVCRVFQGTSPQSAVSLFCAVADAGSPAADVAFTLVVFN